MAKPKPARTGPSLGQEVIALAILGSGILLLIDVHARIGYINLSTLLKIK